MFVLHENLMLVKITPCFVTFLEFASASNCLWVTETHFTDVQSEGYFVVDRLEILERKSLDLCFL